MRILAAAALLLAAGCSRPRPIDLASSDPNRTWLPIVSIPWVNYGADFGGVAAWGVSGVASDHRIDAWFERLAGDGVKAVAWFLLGDGRGALVCDKAGLVTGLAPTFWRDYRAALKAARRSGLQITWVLTDFEIGMPARIERGVPIFGRPDLIEDAAKRRSLIEHALVPILRDGPDAARVAGWIVINEPEHLLRSGYVSEPAMRAFVSEAAAGIRRYQPGQRVGVGNADLAGMLQLAGLPLDFLTLHHYGAALPPATARLRNYLHDSRPIFIGEFNLNSPPGSDLNRFMRACRSLGYAGVWPWSLRTRLNEDTEPQFDLIASYVKAGGGALEEPREDPIPGAEERAATLAASVASHTAQADENSRWAERCRKDLSPDLATATQRARLHSYLAREAASELGWLSFAALNPPAR